ncbi:hypothetical protein EPA93_41245 [Ktedonosporobacter rubrisoli]|uniref:Acyl-CoA dehydrogenase n=1 Tax=Ktedonosporobacter rubrisoli TaxID=2509675 RepID=A0A4P6K1S9_KTERU|nr:acyl-CoA dehydrogenase family protein [Ktedonosporobacter rubrisoli]QBD82064.1 hypothetical protein EPA93_41245 [Ktedonosporobacter rubrisoli]
MLDFSPTEEQEEICRLARSVALEQLRPQGRTAEKKEDISPALMKTLVKTGLTTPFPESLGGSGALEAVTYALIAEELGFGDTGLALNILGSMLGPLAVALCGNKAQQEQYIRPFCAEQEGYKARGSLAFAEPTGGYRLADLQATVRKDGEKLVINGSKRNVIHGGACRPGVALLRLEGSVGSKGLCAVIVPEQAEGLHILIDMHKLGLLAAPSVTYTFENMVVAEAALLGEPGNPGVVRIAALYNILRAGVACGTARAALEYASAYAKERMAFGRPIVSYQGIAFILAEMAMKLDAARLLLWQAATDWDSKVESESLVRSAEAAQRQALYMAQLATTDSLQVMGGAGFMQDHPVEMWMRNIAAME